MTWIADAVGGGWMVVVLLSMTIGFVAGWVGRSWLVAEHRRLEIERARRCHPGTRPWHMGVKS